MTGSPRSVCRAIPASITMKITGFGLGLRTSAL